MLNANFAEVDVGTEAGSIAESLARIVQQCPEDVRSRALSLMNAQNCAQFTVNISHRLNAFLDSRKSRKNDHRSIFERRKSAFHASKQPNASAQSDASADFRLCRSLPLPVLVDTSDFSSDEEDVFSSDENEEGEESGEFSDDADSAMAKTDGDETNPSGQLNIQNLESRDSCMSDVDGSKPMQEAAGSNQHHEQLQETQSLDADEIDVNDDQFSADEVDEQSPNTDLTDELSKCARLSDFSECFDDDDDNDDIDDIVGETRVTDVDAVRDDLSGFSSDEFDH